MKVIVLIIKYLKCIWRQVKHSCGTNCIIVSFVPNNINKYIVYWTYEMCRIKYMYVTVLYTEFSRELYREQNIAMFYIKVDFCSSDWRDM